MRTPGAGLAADPENVKLLFRRAQAELKRGDAHAAEPDLVRALELEPANAAVSGNARRRNLS